MDKSKTEFGFNHYIENKSSSKTGSAEHVLCANCHEELAPLLHPQKPRKTQKISPRKDQIMFIQRPIGNKKPSPYEAKENFQVLKDFFKIQVTDESSPQNEAKYM